MCEAAPSNDSGSSSTPTATPKPKAKPKAKFLAEDERRHAINVLALISKLSQAERRRVLKRALEVNDV